MSDSSQPKSSIQDLAEIKDINDFIISIDASDINLDYNNTMSSGDYVYSYSDCGIDTITLTGTGAAGTLTAGQYIQPLTTNQISNLTTISIDTGAQGQLWGTFNWNQEWEHRFPDWHRVQDMCSKYPGLQIAFNNFKTFYEMCKDDYDNPAPKK